ncbi:hypothetical protein GMLC_29210 [Geomonas limicola]|uniref:YDG domain-containing protein n=1 Tax=Geomonas limicola TaxID=2740186 RepID=A0A6V8N9U1_9BACT|nr:hypothetical protein GMLC_29210 [Geomonas limicola]
MAGSPYAISIGTLSAGSNYSITFVPANLTVTAKPLAINGITANSKVYDGTRSATLNTGTVTLGGVVGSDVVSLSGSATGTFDTKNAGTGKTVSFSGLSLSGAAAGNYSITSTASTTANITPAPLTVLAGSATVANKVYDGSTSATITARGTLGGIIAPDVVTLNGGSANFDDANAGNGKAVTITGLTLGGADAANYALGSTSVSATANIAKADQVLSFSTALIDKVVGDPQFDLTASSNSGLPVSVSVTGPATYAAPTLTLGIPATVAASAADYTVTVTANQAGDVNHNSATLSGTFKVLQLGDITHDGSVTIIDAMEYLKVALHLDPSPSFTRNIFLDGSNRAVIDVRDVLLVLQKVVSQPI